MKQQAIPLFIIMTLLVAPLTVRGAGQNRIAVDEVKADAAKAQAKRREVVVKLRPGTKILIGDKEFPFEFIRGANLSGRIKELRENDFTLSSKSSRTGEVIAVISYADVLSLKHPSGFAKVLKNIGKYPLMAAVGFAILPLYGVLALIGRLPSC